MRKFAYAANTKDYQGEVHADGCTHLLRRRYLEVRERFEAESAEKWIDDVIARYPDEPRYKVAPCAK